MRIKIMTWNIRHGLGMDNRQDLRRVIETIREIGPDIAVLNEVDKYLPRSGFTNQAKYIASKLSMEYFFSPSLGLGPVGFGNAILTKERFTRKDFTWLSRRIFEYRKALIAEIEIGVSRVTCIGVHLSPARKIRFEELQKLQELVDTIQGKLLLAGDLNSKPQAEELRHISSALCDVFQNSALPTFPASNPSVRIDYLFASGDCNIVHSEVIPVQGSDHLPLYAVINI